MIEKKAKELVELLKRVSDVIDERNKLFLETQGLKTKYDELEKLRAKTNEGYMQNVDQLEECKKENERLKHENYLKLKVISELKAELAKLDAKFCAYYIPDYTTNSAICVNCGKTQAFHAMKF